MKRIEYYWDNASTTRVFEAVAEVCSQMMRKDFYNPSALYDKGLAVKRMLDAARASLASSLRVQPNELYFVSGATEANNWVFHSAFKNKKGNVVLSGGEHPSVYEPAMALKNKGYDVRIVPLGADGRIDRNAFLTAVDENTTLVSVIHCSNETGVLNPIRDLVAAAKMRAPGVIFHSDGVQAFCKAEVDLIAMGVDLYSVSAHKIGGPKGIGALYCGKNIAPMLLGGGQEAGRRSGTENTYGIVGFAKAVECFQKQCYDTHNTAYLLSRLQEIPGAVVNGAPEYGSGFILSVSIPGIKSEILQHVLADKGLYVGTGSACSSRLADNRVLRGMGLARERIEGNIRLSFATEITRAELDAGMEILIDGIRELKGRIYGKGNCDPLR